jgi:hypothetical protein
MMELSIKKLRDSIDSVKWKLTIYANYPDRPPNDREKDHEYYLIVKQVYECGIERFEEEKNFISEQLEYYSRLLRQYLFNLLNDDPIQPGNKYKYCNADLLRNLILCKFPVLNVGPSYLNGNRGTIEYVGLRQQPSSKSSESHVIKCSNFRRGLVSQTEDRFNVQLFAINDDPAPDIPVSTGSDPAPSPFHDNEDTIVDAIIMEKLFGRGEESRNHYKDFVKEQSANLQLFRNAIDVFVNTA